MGNVDDSGVPALGGGWSTVPIFFLSPPPQSTPNLTMVSEGTDGGGSPRPKSQEKKDGVIMSVW